MQYFNHAMEGANGNEVGTSVKFQLALCHKFLGLKALRTASKLQKKRIELEKKAMSAAGSPNSLVDGSYAQIEMKVKAANIHRTAKNVQEEEDQQCKEALHHLESGVDRTMEAITDLEGPRTLQQGNADSTVIIHRLYRCT